MARGAQGSAQGISACLVSRLLLTELQLSFQPRLGDAL